MGHCTDCGAPCPHCSKRSDYTLLGLPESIREKLKQLLDDVGCATQQRQDALISTVAQYEENVVLRALRIWKHGGYAMQDKDERYFLGILKNQATVKPQVLEDLPPLLNPEEDR